MATRSWWYGRRLFSTLTGVVNAVALLILWGAFVLSFGMGTPAGTARSFREPFAFSGLAGWVAGWMGIATYVAAIVALIVFLLGWADTKRTGTPRLVSFARRIAGWQFLAHLVLAAAALAGLLWHRRKYFTVPLDSLPS